MARPGVCRVLAGWAAGALVVVLLSGCALSGYADRASVAVDASVADLSGKVADIAGRRLDIPFYERVPGLWISDRVIPRSASQRLPAQFERQFVLREQAGLTLAELADAVRSSARLNVELQGEAVGLALQRFSFDHAGTLSSLLDAASMRFGVVWSWEGGVVVIQQSVAKTFPVRRPGGEAVKALALVGAGAAAAGSAAASSGAAAQDPFAELTAAIKVIAPSARVSVLRSASAIVVSDAPASVKRVADLLEFDEQQSKKQVTLLWRLINFSATDLAESGVDLQYLLARSGGALSLGGATSVVGLGAGILKFESTSGSSKGSSAALKLLNEIGSAHVVKSGVATLKNNGRDDISNEQEIFYLSKVTAATTSVTGTVVPGGLEQASVKVGLTGAFGVAIYDSERMDLSFDFSVAFLDQLKTNESGGQTLQSPEVSRRSGRGVVPVKHGETWILTSQSSDGVSYDRRGLAQGVALGASARGSASREQWMLVVTPILTQKGI